MTMVRKSVWRNLILFAIIYIVIPTAAMDQEKSLHEEIHAIANKDIKSISICLGNCLTHLLETKKANLAYPGYHFIEPAVRLIPLHIKDDSGKPLFTNILLPYALILADRCKIDTVLKYNKKTCEFDMAKINLPFEYSFPKTSSFLREVADKVETEHIIALEQMVVDHKCKKRIDKAFFTAAYEKKVGELSVQIAALKKSRDFFIVGCVFLSIFIFFRCDWWSEREVFNF